MKCPLPDEIFPRRTNWAKGTTLALRVFAGPRLPLLSERGWIAVQNPHGQPFPRP